MVESGQMPKCQLKLENAGNFLCMAPGMEIAHGSYIYGYCTENGWSCDRFLIILLMSYVVLATTTRLNAKLSISFFLETACRDKG